METYGQGSMPGSKWYQAPHWDKGPGVQLGARL